MNADLFYCTEKCSSAKPQNFKKRQLQHVHI